MKKTISFIVYFMAFVFAAIPSYSQSSDSDNDGVANSLDFCPNTPNGTSVNSYGCPVSLNNCDYNTSDVSFNLSSSIPVGKITKFVLAEAETGKIVQVADSPTFRNLTGSKTYMALAYSYEDNNTVVNLIPNKFINQVSATCSDWSNALSVKICSPFLGSNNCDFNSSRITLNTSVPINSNVNNKFLLIKPNGTIVQISDTPTFVGLSGENTYNAYSISYTGTLSNLEVGKMFSEVAGSCLDWSSPLSIKVCVCKDDYCPSVTVLKLK